MHRGGRIAIDDNTNVAALRDTVQEPGQEPGPYEAAAVRNQLDQPAPATPSLRSPSPNLPTR